MKVAIMKFENNNCPACEEVEPVLQKVCKRLNIDIEKVNTSTEKGREKAQMYKVWSNPTVLLLSDDRKVITELRELRDEDRLYEEIVTEINL